MKKINPYIFFEKLSKPAKASLTLMLTQMIQKGLAVVTEPIFTRLLTTTEYGTVSLFLSWYEILIIFTGFVYQKVFLIME